MSPISFILTYQGKVSDCIISVLPVLNWVTFHVVNMILVGERRSGDEWGKVINNQHNDRH